MGKYFWMVPTWLQEFEKEAGYAEEEQVEATDNDSNHHTRDCSCLRDDPRDG